MSARSTDSDNPDRRPEVIVDFTAEEGMLFVSLKNIGARSAYRVVTRFDKPFRGVDGTKAISEMRLFAHLEFLPPGKEFSQFIDPVAVYLKRREPTRIAVMITYTDREGHRFQETIKHDLRVFADLGYIRK